MHDKMTEIRLRVPSSLKASVLKAACDLGAKEVQEDIPEGRPWRECFPEYSPETAARTHLRAARIREGLKQVELAKRTGIPQRHISEMENGKRPIGKTLAKRLGQELNLNYQLLL